MEKHRKTTEKQQENRLKKTTGKTMEYDRKPVKKTPGNGGKNQQKNSGKQRRKKITKKHQETDGKRRKNSGGKKFFAWMCCWLVSILKQV